MCKAVVQGAGVLPLASGMRFKDGFRLQLGHETNDMHHQLERAAV